MSSATSQEIETTEVVPAPRPVSANDSFASLMAGGVQTVLGNTLVKDDGLERLTGVPFLVTSITYRPGITKDKRRFDYVSAEVIVGSEHELEKAARRGQLSVTSREMVDPEERIVFNDGSTGVKRQLTELLSENGWIKLPEGSKGGGLGESVFDSPRTEWVGVNPDVADLRIDPETGEMADTTFAVRLWCPRGLRVSTYKNEYTQEGKTRYLG